MNVPSGGATAVSGQMRQYPLLNFTMAKSARAGAAAVKPSTSTPITSANLFKVIVLCPVFSPSAPTSVASGGQKAFNNRTKEFLTVQMLGMVNVS
jgi:hypothetical protein